jgi:hypothetical protein
MKKNRAAAINNYLPNDINQKIEALNARQVALNEQARAAWAKFEAAQQAYSQEVQTLQTEFTENIGALKLLQSMLRQAETK